MKIGDFVVYTPTNEKGRIKSLVQGSPEAFVVYKCNNDWDNYTNYTAALTCISALKPFDQAKKGVDIVKETILGYIDYWSDYAKTLVVTEWDENRYVAKFNLFGKDRELQLLVLDNEVYINNDSKHCISSEERMFWIHTLG